MAKPKDAGLVLRGSTYHTNMRIPKSLGGGLLRVSLGTSDPARARQIRDMYIVPALANGDAIVVLEAVARQINELRSDARDKMQAIKKGIFGDYDVDLDGCFDKYSSYLDKSELRPRSKIQYKTWVKAVIDEIGNKPMKSLCRADAVKARDGLLERMGVDRRNKAFQGFKSFLRWAASEGLTGAGIEEEFKVQLQKADVTHTAQIPADKADECVSCLKGWTLAPTIARYTGMRVGEIRRLTAKDIYQQDGVWVIHISAESKTHVERLVPIADKLMRLKDKLHLVPDEPKNEKTYNRQIKTVAPDCSFHSWRVYANSQMHRAGVDPYVCKRVLGHCDSKDVHAGYTAVDLVQMKAAVDTIP